VNREDREAFEDMEQRLERALSKNRRMITALELADDVAAGLDPVELCEQIVFTVSAERERAMNLNSLTHVCGALERLCRERRIESIEFRPNGVKANVGGGRMTAQFRDLRSALEDV
jgi:hypothetical protein